jgi:hypothetical protein
MEGAGHMRAEASAAEPSRAARRVAGPNMVLDRVVDYVEQARAGRERCR